MPRTQELKALEEAIDRHNARSGYARGKYSFVGEGKTAPTAGGKTTRSRGECAPENIRIILEAEAKAAEKGCQAIARLLVELNKEA